jgi:hypothetical protein
MEKHIQAMLVIMIAPSSKTVSFRTLRIKMFFKLMPVTVAMRSQAFGRLVAGIVGSNPAQGMDVCPRLSVLCCPV